jgi:hypothetical protein
MITHDEKAYLHDRINSVMKLLFDIVQEMEKWETEFPIEEEEMMSEFLERGLFCSSVYECAVASEREKLIARFANYSMAQAEAKRLNKSLQRKGNPSDIFYIAKRYDLIKKEGNS